MTRYLLLFVALALGVVPVGCNSVSGTGRSQMNLYAPSDDVRIGDQAWADIRNGPNVLQSGPEFDRVQRVGERIVAAANRLHPRVTRNFEWEFLVIDEPDQINAFALPGGKFAVYTGMLNLTRGSNDMLAAVLGHEAAHVTSRHGTERLTQVTLTSLGVGAANIFVLGDLDPDDRNLVLEAIGAGANVGILLPFSRAHESEADVLGVYIAAEAGFDPNGAIRLWQRMAEQGGGQPTEFLSTHPSHDTRIERLRAVMPEARRIRAAALEREEGS